MRMDVKKPRFAAFLFKCIYQLAVPYNTHTARKTSSMAFETLFLQQVCLKEWLFIKLWHIYWKKSWAELAVEYHWALEYPLVISYLALISASNLICWDIKAFCNTRRVALEENWRLMSFLKQANQLENKTGLDYLDLKLQLHIIGTGLKTLCFYKYCVLISLNLSSAFW